MSLGLVDKDTGEISERESIEFSDFWLLYPRRVARKDAERAWLKLPDPQRLQALVAIVDWRRVWADKDVEYLPHAATWLNGWRFEDELPPSFTQSSLSHRSFESMELPKDRGTIPEHVKALISKLRGKGKP